MAGLGRLAADNPDVERRTKWKSAAYEDDGRKLLAVAEDDGTRRDGYAQWACQVLRDAEAVSAEVMTIDIESPTGRREEAPSPALSEQYRTRARPRHPCRAARRA